MKRSLRSALSLLLTLVLAGSLFFAPAMAIDSHAVSSLSASYSPGMVSVSGTTSPDVLAVALLLYSGDTLLRLETAGVTDQAFSATIQITLPYGAYTVKAADYEGGEYTIATFSYTAPVGGGNGGGSKEPGNATVSGGGGSIDVEATINGSRAVLDIDTNQLDDILDGSALSINVSGLSSNIDGVTIPAAAAQGELGGLTLVLSTVTVTFDADALGSLVSGSDGFDAITISAELVGRSSLTDAQAECIPTGATVLDLMATATKTGAGGAKTISAFAGTVTVSIPYPLAPGEDPSHITIYFINDAGQVEKFICAYDAATGCVTFKTDHFSVYAVVSESIAAFTDVKLGDWYYEAMDYIVTAGLFSGTSGTTLSPDVTSSRAMLVTVLHRLEGKPSMGGGKSGTFVDVPENEWYTEAVEWAAANAIVDGYGDGTFGPGDSLTREQMFTILYRYAVAKEFDLPAGSNLAGYTNTNQISAWALPAMRWAVAAGITTGTTATTLSPKGSATRAQMAMTFMRFIENVMQ